MSPVVSEGINLVAQVWASKWSERAWLSRRARGVKDSDLYMAVLLQQVRTLHLVYVHKRLQALICLSLPPS